MNKPVKICCTICARGGSKGVKNKNIRIIGGHPLIAHTIQQAKATELFDIIAVSSDSNEILEIAKEYGADMIIQRPGELATDYAAKIPVIQHAGLEVEKSTGLIFDYFVDLDATSPLRSVDDIVEVVKMIKEKKYDNIITGCLSRRSPYFNLVEEKGGYVILSKFTEPPVVRRQDAPNTYDMNASIYAWDRNTFMSMTSIFTERTGIYVMPEERSHDIDSELDFKIVEILMEHDNGQ